MKKFGLLISLLLLTAQLAWGQVSITSVSTAFTQNFDGMGSTGTTTPTGWFVGTGTAAASTTVVVGTGSSTAGNNYNFGVAGTNPITDRALGSLCSGSTLRNTEGRFTNNTGVSITSITITYDGEQWRLGQTGSLEIGLVLFYSTDGTNYTAMGSSYNFIPPITVGTAGALDGNASANRITGIGGTYTPASTIANGVTFYLRWVDSDNSGSDAANAIDNFSITANGSAGTPTLSVIPTTLPITFSYVQGSGPSASQTYTLSGTDLTGAPGNITVTGSTNYEVQQITQPLIQV